ncbi:predicted protein [Nematostella vectensis]|uniref:Radial spoke head 1 homolog n=1 Tax=Nematostella vectensis TaxID=45351 RepID=A7SAB7_NEMVE|nr:radial spoke head 1 homolog [Nematostella vectensis]EDO39343.1 predicted protein [Nematostella vectensis]|eukprot:XP_001631406.1 predicted protein [Nematostella vectensis]
MDDSDEELLQNADIGEYEGDRNELGERHGQGKALHGNGDLYTGSYWNGKRHGKGTYIFRKGARYMGFYENNKKNGKGTFTYPDGSRYEGTWSDDERHGVGTYFYTNGDTYEGEWRSNRRHGKGTYTDAHTNVKLEGTWEKGKLNGHCKIIHSDHRFEGVFAENLPTGPGKYVFEKGFIQYGLYHIVEKKQSKYDEEEEPTRTPIWKCVALEATIPV